MKLLIGFTREEYPEVAIFEQLGDCTFQRYDQAFLEEHIHEYDILVTHLFFPIESSIIEKASRLKILATPSTGSDHVDIPALEKKKIEFITLNEDREFIDSIPSTAEMAWLLIMAVSRKLRFLVDRVQQEKSWVNTYIRGYEVKGKTLGIIGYGRLGKKVARFAQAFDMRVIAFDTNPDVFDDNSAVEPVEFDTLLGKSDIISLHVKLNETSRGMINQDAISKMQDGVRIANTSRGDVLDPEAILKGLAQGKIAAVGSDVCCGEYQSTQLPDDPLVAASFTDKRIIITPHAGGATHDAHRVVFGHVAGLIEKRLGAEE